MADVTKLIGIQISLERCTGITGLYNINIIKKIKDISFIPLDDL